MEKPPKTTLMKASAKRANNCRARQLDDRRGREEPLRLDVINQRAKHQEMVRRSQQVGTIPAPQPEPVADHSAAINKFLQVARAGRYGTASSGEQTAHRLAAALYQIGDDIALLDSGTLEGFLKIVRLAAGPWPTDESKRQIYTAIEAAGKKP